MPKEKKETKFTEHCWKVYKLDEYKTGGSELRIESWTVTPPGIEHPPRLCRRDYFLTGEKGERKTGKSKGLTIDDVSFVESNGIAIANEMIRIRDLIKSKANKPAAQSETVPPENWNS